MLEVKKKGRSTLQRFECVMHPVPPGTKRRGPRPLRGSEWALPPILVDIVVTGMRRIQEMGRAGNAQRCAIEAEHVQHLPALLYEYDPEVLQHYWNVERIGEMFEPLWQALGDVLQAYENERRSGQA